MLKSKDQAHSMFKHYKNEVEKQLNIKINNRYGEHETIFSELYFVNDIIHQSTRS